MIESILHTMATPTGLEDGLDHRAGLEHALNKADEIATPLLQGVVRLAQPVHGQHDEKTLLLALEKNKIRTGGGQTRISRAFERPLPYASVVDVEAIDG